MWLGTCDSREGKNWGDEVTDFLIKNGIGACYTQSEIFLGG